MNSRLLATLSACLTLPSLGHAADNDRRFRGIEEIIVTATKRQERLQDIPISIAVVGNQDIERRGVIGMEDYLRAIPSVNQVDLGTNKNGIVIRGVSTSPEGDATVGVYFDETPITGGLGTSFAGPDVRPVDIERIEVLRGPQGTAYGSSSMGGALRIIPAKPDLEEFGGKLAASYSETEGLGSDNSMVQGILNVPIVADHFALRVVGYRYDDSGFYRNIAGVDPTFMAQAQSAGLGDFVRGYTQDDVGHMVSTGGRLAALWKATDKLTLSMNFWTQTIEQDGQPATTINLFDQTRMPVAPQARIRGEVGEAIDNSIDLANLVVNYDFDWAELTTAVSAIDGESKGASFVSLPSVPSTTINPSEFQSLTAESRLASKLSGPFQFLGGLYYEAIDTKVFQTGDWPGDPSTNPARTDPTFVFNAERDYEQYAVFGEASFDVTKSLTATLGGRYYHYDRDESTLTEGGFVRVPYGTGAPAVLKGGDSGTTFKANLDYKFSDDAMMYVSWAQGFRLGRPQNVTTLRGACDRDVNGIIDNTNISLNSIEMIDADTLDSYEIGGKFSLLDHRLYVDAAAYYIEWQGLPVAQIATGCQLAYVANAGEATSTGVEAQASFYATESLRFDLGGSYTHAELSDDVLTLNAKAGARLPGSPEVSANLAAQYDFTIANLGSFVRVDSFYNGEFYGNLQETPDFRVGDYIKVDARAGVSINSLSLEIFVKNVTNEDALTWRSTVYRGNMYRMRPRTIGLQIGYSFE
jgi:outer membrane receptor protein involved in Fe transport